MFSYSSMWDPLLMAVVLRSSEFQRQLGAVDVGVQLTHGAQHDHLRRKYPITHAQRCENTGIIVLHEYLAHKYRCLIYFFIHIWNRKRFNYSSKQKVEHSFPPNQSLYEIISAVFIFMWNLSLFLCPKSYILNSSTHPEILDFFWSILLGW